MLKELLLLRNEVGGIQLNWDGSEVFHLVIRNSWVDRIRLCHSHNVEHDGLVGRRIRFRRRPDSTASAVSRYSSTCTSVSLYTSRADGCRR
jgi:hypothetical protein